MRVFYKIPGIEVVSEQKRMFLLVVTVHALFQLEHPEWSPRYDSDPDLARTTRVELLQRAAGLDILVHTYHFPFPGFGTIVKEQSGFSFKKL